MDWTGMGRRGLAWNGVDRLGWEGRGLGWLGMDRTGQERQGVEWFYFIQQSVGRLGRSILR
jgi:hypothetical protein